MTISYLKAEYSGYNFNHANVTVYNHQHGYLGCVGKVSYFRIKEGNIYIFVGSLSERSSRFKSNRVWIKLTQSPTGMVEELEGYLFIISIIEKEQLDKELTMLELTS